MSMNVSNVQLNINQKKSSNKSAKIGAAVGFGVASINAIMNRDLMKVSFVKNLKAGGSKNSLILATVGGFLAAAATLSTIGALIGKGVGLLVNKFKSTKNEARL